MRALCAPSLCTKSTNLNADDGHINYLCKHSKCWSISQQSPVLSFNLSDAFFSVFGQFVSSCDVRHHIVKSEKFFWPFNETVCSRNNNEKTSQTLAFGSLGCAHTHLTTHIHLDQSLVFVPFFCLWDCECFKTTKTSIKYNKNYYFHYRKRIKHRLSTLQPTHSHRRRY